MISAKYIHDYDEYDDLSRYIIESDNAIDRLMADYHYMCEESRLLDLDFDDVFMEGKQTPKKEEPKKEDPKKASLLNKIAQKLGEQIINVINKVKALVKKVQDFFQEKIFKRKNNMQKLEMLMKKNPNLAKEINFAITSGDLEIKDYKTMKDLMDGTSDILDKINKGKLDKNGAEKAFEKLDTKWNKFGKPLIAIAGGVTASLGAYVAVKQFFPQICKARIEAKMYGSQMDEIQARGQMQQRAERRDAGLEEEVGLARLKNKIITKCCDRIAANTRKQESLFGRFATWMDSSLKKLMSSDENDMKKIEKAQKTADIVDDVTKRQERRESDRRAVFAQKLRDEGKETPDEAAEKAGKIKTKQLEAEQEFNNRPGNRDQRLKDAEDTALAQSRGQARGRAENRNQSIKDAEDTAAAQAKGQAKGKADYHAQNKGLVTTQAREISNAQEKGKIAARTDLQDTVNAQAKRQGYYQRQGQNAADKHSRQNPNKKKKKRNP